MFPILSASQKWMLDHAQGVELLLRRTRFEKALAITSLSAVSHTECVRTDYWTHPTRNKSSSLSIADRPSTKQICADWCCNYLQKSCQQLLPQNGFQTHRGTLYLLSNTPRQCAFGSAVCNSTLSNTIGYSESQICMISNYSSVLNFYHSFSVTWVSVNHKQIQTVGAGWLTLQPLPTAHLHP